MIHRQQAAGIAFAALAAVAFGTLAISGKFAYREGASVAPLLGARFALAALLLGTAARLRGGSTSPRRVLQLLALGGIGYAAESALFFAALGRAPAGVLSLIFYSYPVMTAAVAMSLGMESVSARTLVSLLLGTAGVALLFTVSLDGIAGPLLALTAAACVAVYLLVAQVVTRGVDPVSSGGWTAAGAAIALVAVSAATRTGLPAAALPWAGALGLATAIAFWSLYAAIARIGSSRTAIAAMLEPVTTLLLAALLLGEPLSGRVILGAVLVVSALPVLAGSRGEEPAAPPPDAL